MKQSSATTLPPLPDGFELEAPDATTPIAKPAPEPGMWRVPPEGQPVTEGPLAGYALRPDGPDRYTPVRVAQSARAPNISARALPALPAGFELEGPASANSEAPSSDGRDATINSKQLKGPNDAGAAGFGKLLAQRFTQGALYTAKAIPAAVQMATSGADEDSFLSDLNRNARAVSDALTGTSEGIEADIDPYRRAQSQAQAGFYRDAAGKVRFQIPNKEQFFGTLAGSLAPGRVIAGAGRGAAKLAGKAGLSTTPAKMIGFGAANVALIAPNVYEETFRQGKELGLTDAQADVAGNRAVQMFAPVAAITGGIGGGLAASSTGGVVTRAIKGGLKEAIPEGVEELAEYTSQQAALDQPIDPVQAQTVAVLGGIGGLGQGAIAGVVGGEDAPRDAPATNPPGGPSKNINAETLIGREAAPPDGPGGGAPFGEGALAADEAPAPAAPLNDGVTPIDLLQTGGGLPAQPRAANNPGAPAANAPVAPAAMGLPDVESMDFTAPPAASGLPDESYVEWQQRASAPAVETAPSALTDTAANPPASTPEATPAPTIKAEGSDPQTKLPRGTVRGGSEAVLALHDRVVAGQLAKNKKAAVRYRAVDGEEAARLQTATGFDLAGYEHAIDSFAINKIYKDHGSAKTENPRGQVPITRADILKIPDIVAMPDAVSTVGKDRIGNDLLRYVKRDNGVVYYVEEVRTGRGELMAKTLWKTRATMSDAESGPARTPATLDRNPPQGDSEPAGISGSRPAVLPEREHQPAASLIESVPQGPELPAQTPRGPPLESEVQNQVTEAPQGASAFEGFELAQAEAREVDKNADKVDKNADKVDKPPRDLFGDTPTQQQALADAQRSVDARLAPNEAVPPVEAEEGLWSGRERQADAFDKLSAGIEDAPAPDRRQDSETRKRVAEMSRDELRQALLTDPLTGIGNRRAYDEAPRKAVQASLDADALKWINDNMGHGSGDKLLSAIGQALRQATPDAYHISGDEFIAEFDSEQQATEVLADVRARLRDSVIEATVPDGAKITKRGVEFSYGTGANLDAAERQLQADKQARAKAGLRAARGGEPPGVVRTPAQRERDQQGDVAAAAAEAERALGELYDRALTSDEQRVVTYGAVDAAEAARLRVAVGIDLSGFEHAVDSDAIRHITKQHGASTREQPRGQEPVTREDILRIPDIVRSHDTVERGKSDHEGRGRLIYSKRYNGVTYYVEEVRNKRKQLVSKTLWKTRTAPRATSEEGVAHTSATSSRNLPRADNSINQADPGDQTTARLVKENAPKLKQAAAEVQKPALTIADFTNKAGEVKSIIVTGDIDAYEARIKGAVKGRALKNKTHQGYVFAKQHEAAVRAALADLLGDAKPTVGGRDAQAGQAGDKQAAPAGPAPVARLIENAASVDTSQERVEKTAKTKQVAATQPKPRATPTTGELTDVGAKIGGARKDWRARGLTEADLEGMSAGEETQAVTKAHIWKPDYKAMLAGGADVEAAATLKVIYDRLAATPHRDTPAGRRQYLKMMGLVRDAYQGVKTANDLKAARETLFKSLGWYEGGSQDNDTRDTLFSVYKGRKSPFALGYNERRSAQKLIDKGWPNTRQTTPKPKPADGETPARPALDKLKRVGPQRRTRNVSAQDFMDAFGFRGVEFGNWAASDERQKHVNEAHDALLDLAETLGVPPKAISLNGTLGVAFGARGTKFAAHYEPGKLVINIAKLSGPGAAAHEWGHALDHYFGELERADAYQGGARGASGWYTQPRMGDFKRLGALRAEMGSAFDGLLRAIYQRDKTQAEVVREAELALEKHQADVERVRLAGARFVEQGDKINARHQRDWLIKHGEPRLKQLQSVLERARGLEAGQPLGKTLSSYFEQAKKLSGKSGAKGYWARPTELFARAFESYVFDRLAQQNRQTDYLVHGVEAGRFASPLHKGDPYPAGLERQAINQAFDGLFETMQSKETEQGVALYSEGTFGEFSDQLLARRAEVAAELKTIVSRLAPKADLQLFDAMTREVSGRQGYVAGSQVGATIKLALNYSDAPATAWHEALHFLKRLGYFSEAEWSALEAKAPAWEKQYGQTDTEEAIAVAFEAFGKRADKPDAGLIAKAWTRLRLFIERFGNWLRRNGFQSAEDVFARIATGEAGRRFAPARETLAGYDALQAVASQHTDRGGAMRHRTLGAVSFYWGAEGTPAKDFRDGHGVSHIIARRLAERNTPGEVAEILRRVVDAIAFGKAGEPYGPGRRRVDVSFGGHTAVLSLERFGDQETWLLTGFDEKPGATGVSSIPGGYAPVSFGSRKQVVADLTPILDAARREINGSGEKYHPAWHGSPYEFERFGLHAIGSGEGAQAYGWGLYFASKREVAEFYRDALGDLKVGVLDAGNGKFSAWLRKQGSEYATLVGEYDSRAAAQTALDRAARGRLYQVQLAPQEDAYLDWDKPLAAQSETVKTALKEMGEYGDAGEWRKNFSSTRPSWQSGDANILQNEDGTYRFWVGVGSGHSAATFARAKVKVGVLLKRARKNQTGKDLYRIVSGRAGAQRASEQLAAAGIPGIRYLDGSSRGQGAGSTNYVIFDEKLVNIIARYARGGKGGGANTERVRRWLAKPIARLNVPVEIVATVAELNARAALPKPAPADTQGVAWQGKVWLVAANLRTAKEARAKLIHEAAGHLGLEGMLGREAFAKLVRQVQNELRIGNRTLRNAAQRVAETHETDGKLDADTQTREILAYLAENGLQSALLRRVVAQVRVWLARMGFGNVADAEIEQLIARAARFVEARPEQSRRGKARHVRRARDAQGRFASPAYAQDATSGQAPGLFDKPAVLVTSLSGDEFSTSHNRDVLRPYVDQYVHNLQGKPLPNQDTGWRLVIAKQDRNKLTGDFRQTLAGLRALAGIEDIANRAVLAETHADDKQNPDVVAVHRLYAPIEIAGQIFRAKLTVREYRSEKRNLHALQTVEISGPAAYPSDPMRTGAQAKSAQPAGPTVSIVDLLAGAKRDGDGQPFDPASTPDYAHAAPTFYSQLQRYLTDKLPGQGTPGELTRQLDAAAAKGQFKAEELAWSGLKEWLNGHARKVTREEVLAFARANQIEVKEVVKGGDDISVDTIGGGVWEVKIGERTAYMEDFDGSYDDAIKEARKRFGATGTKFGPKSHPNLSMPGGQNYRELLLTLPAAEIKRAQVVPHPDDPSQWAIQKPNGEYVMSNGEIDMHDDGASAERLANKTSSEKAFLASHFDEPNILAHIRFNERTDTDGKRVLFMEEVQSDWHQEGRKQGYNTPPTPSDIRVVATDTGFGVSVNGQLMQASSDREAAEAAAQRMRNNPRTRTTISVPNAPFKTTWPMLAMKRMLRFAAENGFDRIAWTTGAQQAARYDLSKQVDAIYAKRNDDGTYALGAMTEAGVKEVGASVPESRLEDMVGKDLAKKIAAQNPGEQSYEGTDLKVGGEGMQGFYDRILPNEVNKYVKKWGAKVGRVTIPTAGPEADWFTGGSPSAPRGAQVHALDITPQMREAALAGQALFTRITPGAPFARYAALGAESVSLFQAWQQVPKIIGFKPPFPLKANRNLPPTVPARFDLEAGIIEFNPDLETSTAQAVQWLVEEVLHGVDVVGADRTISASSALLDETSGVIWNEASEHYRANGELATFLAYPLDADTFGALSASQIKAELFARLGVIYLGDPAKLRALLPQTYEAYHNVFALNPAAPTDGEYVFRKVWSPAGGDAQVRGGYRTDRGTLSGGSGRAQGGRADRGLGPIRRATATAFGGRAQGAKVQFGRSLETRVAQAAVPAAQSALPGTRKAGQPTDAALAQAMRKAGMGPKEGLAAHAFHYLASARQAWRDGVATAGIFDGVHGIKRAEQLVHGLLPAEQSGYVAARMATGTDVVMRAMLEDGAPEWRDGTLAIKAGTRGLLEVLGPIKGDLDAFMGWMIGRRARRLLGEGRENNFTQADIDALLQAGEQAGSFQHFEAVAAEFDTFKKAVLDVAEQAGLINPDNRVLWEQADYIPFYRAIEAGRQGPKGKRGLSHQSSGIKQLKGGTAELGDPLENILVNFAQLMGAAMKNHALRLTLVNLKDNREFVERLPAQFGRALIPMSQVQNLMDEYGIGKALPKDALQSMQHMLAYKIPTEPDVVRVMDRGKPHYFKVNDALLLNALTAIEQAPLDFMPIRIGRRFKRLLTGMVTASPDFILRNFIRDAVHAWTINEDQFKLGIDSFRGAVRTLRKSDSTIALMFAGASFQGGYLNANDPGGVAKSMRKALRARGYDSGAFMASIVDSPMRLWEKYRELGDAMENANRVAVYEAALAAGKSHAQAAFEAKDLMDYSMQGNWKTVQVLNAVIPFLNARLQGNYKLYRSGALPGPKLRAKAFRRGMSIALFSLALWALNKDDERYEELEDWEKDMYWHVFLGEGVKGHIRIPKPFEVGVIYGTIPERMARLMVGSDDAEKSFQQFLWNLRNVFAFNPAPQAIAPILDVYANKDSFTKRAIEGMADEGKLPSARHSERTSDTMRAVGNLISDPTGLSPKQLEHLFEGYLGTMGAYILSAVDVGFRRAGDAPPQPTMRWDQVPVIKSFYREDPAFSTRYTTEFYDMLSEVEEINRTVNAYTDEGKANQARALITKARDKLVVRRGLTDTQDWLSRVTKRIDAIYRSDTMSPDAKRIEVDRLLSLRNERTRQKVEAVESRF